jgi:signal transduction histidine kinase
MQRVNGMLVIQVDDDGPGIPEGELHRAVQRGERLDESVVGHGLGLAIVADKVDAYKGSLRFDSNEQGGLSVRIELPWH